MEEKWSPEGLSSDQLETLLPHTELDSVEDLSTALKSLAELIDLMPRSSGRNRFHERQLSPDRTEYVLYTEDLTPENCEKVNRILEDLGLATWPSETTIALSDERDKTFAELLGLVSGREPVLRGRRARDNFQHMVEGAMSEARRREAALDDAEGAALAGIMPQQRYFPARGRWQRQPLHPELKRHSAEQIGDELPPEDPVEIDELIDATVAKFNEGTMDLFEVFEECGIDTSELEKTTKESLLPPVPLGETLFRRASRQFFWKKGVLYKGTHKKNEVMPKDELTRLYEKARPVADLLWQADVLIRKARQEVNQVQRDAMLKEAKSLQDKATRDTNGISARDALHEIHGGFAVTRVLRALKRKVVRQSALTGANDLLQEARLGLDRAIARFDAVTWDIAFGTFAAHHIDQRINRWISLHRAPARLPVHISSEASVLYDLADLSVRIRDVPEEGFSLSASDRARRKVNMAGDRGIAHSAYQLDRKERNVMLPDDTHQLPVSTVDEEARADKTDMRGERIHSLPEVSDVDKADTRRVISQLITKTLTPREERVVRLRFGIGGLGDTFGEEHTHDETALHIGSPVHGGTVTRERIRQMEAKALRKLKWALRRDFGSRDRKGNKVMEWTDVLRTFGIEE